MQDFVFECLSEELPFKVQNFLQSEIKILFINELQKFNICYDDISVFTTPRRYVVYVSKIEVIQSICEIKGPKENANNEVIAQFLKRVNKTQDELYIKKISNRNYFFVNEYKDINLSQVLKLTIENVLSKINWQKSMRWGRYSIKCIRPIIGIMALLDDLVIDVQFYHYKSSNKTLGHRFLSKEEIVVTNAKEYMHLIAENFVILDQNKRKEKIRSLIKSFLEEKNLMIKIDEDLLDEVNSLVEYPVLICGSIPEFFINMLPKELIEITMKNHQRFFSCFYKDKTMAPYFIAVSNIFSNENIIQGYEKVLKARLSDAISLMEVDKKHSINDFSSKLKEIVFHVKLGTISQKVNRINTLAKYIALWVNGASIINVEKAVLLSKIDLATSVIDEFPELEGSISAYYCIANGGEEEIAEIIKEHNYPINSSSECTHNPASAAISIADKLDSLVGLVIAGENFDSAKDPFCIRRNAIGLIRTIFENNINIPLKLVIEKSVSLFPQKLFSSKIIDKIKGDKTLKRVDVITKVLNYFWERIYIMLKNDDIRIEFLKNNKFNNHPLELKNNAKFLKEFLSTDDGIQFIKVYRRLSNILHKTDLILNTVLNKKLFKTESEIELVNNFNKIESNIIKLSKKNNIIAIISNLNELTKYLENFMNNVTVHSVDEKQTFNKLNLLNRIRIMCNKSIDFELIIKNK